MIARLRRLRRRLRREIAIVRYQAAAIGDGRLDHDGPLRSSIPPEIPPHVRR